MFKNTKSKFKNYLSVATCLSILATSTSPIFASTEFKPLLKSPISVKSTNQFIEKNEFSSLVIDLPLLSGLNNTELQTKLNNQFQTEGKAIYNQFLADREEWKKTGSDIPYSLQLDYEVVTDKNAETIPKPNNGIY